MLWADTHKGETAIVMGNGESLKYVPKEFLEEHPTFGANHVYLFPLQPTYYVCVDTRILEHHAMKIRGVAQRSHIAFLSDEHLDTPMPGVKELYQLDNVFLCNERTIRFPGEFYWSGGTVVYAMLKIAYAMGFSKVLLVGCDRDKEWKHFSNKYPGEYTPPDYRRQQVYHLGIAGEMYEENGRRIVNLSYPSVLDKYFERGEMEDYL